MEIFVWLPEYGLIMDSQRPMKMVIFAYLHVKPPPLHENLGYYVDFVKDLEYL